ncbi:hypothetical protein KCP76_20285 [Salmonella enterica subsp. enterica serovar Weltevreden]|nr:hypothetical protein KCP76_20285 [Salmonella enterica subsp. enterica serovar Weltevreden]
MARAGYGGTGGRGRIRQPDWRVGQEVIVDFLNGDPTSPLLWGAPTTRKTARRAACRAPKR